MNTAEDRENTNELVIQFQGHEELYNDIIEIPYSMYESLLKKDLKNSRNSELQEYIIQKFTDLVKFSYPEIQYINILNIQILPLTYTEIQDIVISQTVGVDTRDYELDENELNICLMPSSIFDSHITADLTIKILITYSLKNIKTHTNKEKLKRHII